MEIKLAIRLGGQEVVVRAIGAAVLQVVTDREQPPLRVVQQRKIHLHRHRFVALAKMLISIAIGASLLGTGGDIGNECVEAGTPPLGFLGGNAAAFRCLSKFC